VVVTVSICWLEFMPRVRLEKRGAYNTGPFLLSGVPMRITRRLEFDAGHRIPDHASQCRHLHGHRYALEITLSGDIIRPTARR
jgi:hypothetical protein